MGRELQKKKNRSSTPKVRHKPKSKRVNPLGNPIIAANWNSHESLSQNYRRLGLTAKLNSTSGGSEHAASKSSTAHKLAIATAAPTVLAPTEATVERDAETGKIVRVIHEGAVGRLNPLNDPLLSDEEGEEEWAGLGEGREGNGVVRELEVLAGMGKEKRPRAQSQREREWVRRLVERYGDDVGKMVRDRKLNPMQQTEADITRRIKRWKEGGEV